MPVNRFSFMISNFLFVQSFKSYPVKFERRGLRGENEKRRRLRWRSVQYATEWVQRQCLVQDGCGILRQAFGIVRKNPRYSVVLENFARFLQIFGEEKSRAVLDAVETFVRTSGHSGLPGPIGDRGRKPPRRKKRMHVVRLQTERQFAQLRRFIPQFYTSG